MDMVLDYQIIPAHVFHDRKERALAAARFFRDLYDGKLHDDEAINIWTINRVTGKKTSTLFRDFEQAGRFAAEQCDDCDVFFQVGVSNVRISGGQRFTAKQITGLVILWSDFDIAHGDEAIHKTKNLIPDFESAIRIACDEFGRPPVKIVISGHGVHLYWPTRRLAPTDAALLELRLLAALRGLAARHGWSGVDTVQDLARVMRVPGTRNLKDPEHPLDVYELTAGVAFTDCDVAQIDAAIEATGYKPTINTASAKITGRVKAELAIAREAVDGYDLLDDADVLGAARNARNGDKFRALYDEGTRLLHDNNHSVADFSLLMMLAFWTNDNIRQMDRLFAKSALMRSEKWDVIHTADGLTYGQYSIARAIAKREQEREQAQNSDAASVTN